MTTTPDDRPHAPGPRQPAHDEPTQASGPGAGADASVLGWPEWMDDSRMAGSLTVAEAAALARQDAADRDLDDPTYSDDPDCSAPQEWLALPSSEQARLVAEELDERERKASVPEAIAAGFTHQDGGNGTGLRAGGAVDEMLPGSDLAWHMGQATRRGLQALSDDELIGYLGGTQKLESWAAGLKHEAVLELDARRAGPGGAPGEHVAAEAGKELTLTHRSAQTLLERARALGRLRPVLILLCAGILDVRKADVIWHRLCLLPGDHARKVLDAVLPRAAALTTAELGEALDHAIRKVDPAAARKRKVKAQQDARVETWAEDAGTAALAGRDLPPADVITARATLAADATWLKDHGLPGTRDQLTALAFTARLNGRPLTSLLPAPAPASTSSAGAGAGPAATPAPGTSDTGTSASPATGAGRPDGLAGTVNLTVPASAWLGLSDNPGAVAGYGAADADTCRDLADRLAAGGPATKWCITLVSQQGQATGHGCARTPPPATTPPATPPGTGPPGTPPPATGPPATGPPAADSARLDWLTSITITPIAAGSCSHERESPRYRPPESLRHLIKIRSPRCGEPGCRAPARRADDDHTIPYHLGGKTCECNLQPMCRRSHRTKQAPGWHVTQPEPGLLIWTLPSGRTYTNITEPYPI